jgi:peptidoglycan hydrolase-like protein with peptidoglycan-binding domain
MQALLLRHQHQSDVEAAKIAEAQQLLKENGFYHGPVDGTMNQRTREALPSFQESRQLNVTGRIDQELGLRDRTTQKASGRFNNSA